MDQVHGSDIADDNPGNGHFLSAGSRFALSQWVTALLRNDVSHWLGTSLESALFLYENIHIFIECLRDITCD